MQSLQDEFFSDSELGTVQLADLDFDESNRDTDDPEEWRYVRARTGTRDTLLYSTGIYKVLSVTSDDPIPEDFVESATEDEVLAEMPLKMKRSMAVPSPSGEYLVLKEATDAGSEKEIDTIGRVKYIPVEYVIEVLTFEEVVNQV